MRNVIYLIFIFFPLIIQGQNVVIKGFVVDKDNKPIAGSSIYEQKSGIGAITDSQGKFSFTLKNPGKYTLVIKAMNYNTLDTTLYIPQKGLSVKFVLNAQAYAMNPIVKTAEYNELTGSTRMTYKVFNLVPSASGNAVETLIKTAMGVQSNNELSSQYNVRGGNFDENLVYINGIQIFRPMLIHSGQQEGMSTINPDMVQSLDFYAGGYQAKYDDKMSSVLDVRYKVANENMVKLTLSMLNSGIYISHISENKKLHFSLGSRVKKNSYLLKSLDTKGDYKPLFFDLQTFTRYDLSNKIKIDFYSYFADNRYNFYPSTSTIAFGTFTDAMQMSIFYDGQEKDMYLSSLNALTFNYRWNDKTQTKLIASAYLSNERENYTFNAAYALNKVDEEFYSESFGDSLLNLGVGQFIDYARNSMNIKIYSLQIKNNKEIKGHSIESGVKYQLEDISENTLRWYYIDSAGYSFSLDKNPYYLSLYDYSSGSARLISRKISAYVQDYFSFYAGLTKISLSAGLRYTFWDYANEHLFSPRLNVLVIPPWEKQWTFRFASGIYYQIPFFREMVDFDGNLTDNPHSQKSVHFVAGAYRNFMMWDRPFKFTTELYYKKLDNLIPYEVDNLRIQYYANQIAKGYAAGSDFRIYGQFVEGVDSWLSLSLMSTKEDIYNDAYWQYLDKDGNPTVISSLIADSVYVEPGYIPRPTDQRVSIGMFFQDYMPGDERFRVSLSLFYGTGRPFGPPQTGRQFAVLRTKSFLRADIGFSYDLTSVFKKTKQTLVQVDILNIFDYRNVASYTWLTVLGNTAVIGTPDIIKIAVPNYLTGRMLNISFTVKF